MGPADIVATSPARCDIKVSHIMMHPIQLPTVLSPQRHHTSSEQTSARKKMLTPDIGRKVNEATISNERKIVLYKRGHEIDGKHYIVEISRKIQSPNEQSVIAYSLEEEGNLCLELNATRCNDFLWWHQHRRGRVGPV